MKLYQLLLEKVQTIREKIVEKPVYRVKKSQLSELDKKLEQELGVAKASYLRERQKRIELEEHVRQKQNLNASRYLADKQKMLHGHKYQGALDMEKLFMLIAQRRAMKKPFRVMSYNLKKDFGELDKLVVCKDGQLALWIKDEYGNSRPVISGQDVKKIFRNYGGLSEVVKTGIFIVNLNEDGEFDENKDEIDVPNTTIDENGTTRISETDWRPFAEQLQRAQRTIRSLQEARMVAEMTAERMEQENKAMETELEIANERADTASTLMQKHLRGKGALLGIVENLKEEIAALSLRNRVSETATDTYTDALAAIQEKLKHKLPLEARDELFESIQDEIRAVAQVARQMQPETKYIQVPVPMLQNGQAQSAPEKKLSPTEAMLEDQKQKTTAFLKRVSEVT